VNLLIPTGLAFGLFYYFYYANLMIFGNPRAPESESHFIYDCSGHLLCGTISQGIVLNSMIFIQEFKKYIRPGIAKLCRMYAFLYICHNTYSAFFTATYFHNHLESAHGIVLGIISVIMAFFFSQPSMTLYKIVCLTLNLNSQL
jgi:hypothetical protein